MRFYSVCQQLNQWRQNIPLISLHYMLTFTLNFFVKPFPVSSSLYLYYLSVCGFTQANHQKMNLQIVLYNLNFKKCSF